MLIENVKNKTNLVSRAGEKLAEALAGFSYEMKNKVVMDVGSSTGGFTELALDKGAKRVVAVEKGTKQMKAPLRFDPRIDLREKTDIFEVKEEEFDGIEVVLVDVSFVSLRKILEYFGQKRNLKKADFLVMLKPQFEASERELNRGVVKNEKIRREIIKKFEEWLKLKRWRVIKKRDNQLKGRKGNRERFYWLKQF